MLGHSGGNKGVVSLVSDPRQDNTGTHFSQEEKCGLKCTHNEYVGWRDAEMLTSPVYLHCVGSSSHLK